MRDPPVTRSDLRRALVFNALAKPVNVLVPTGVLVAAALVGAAWLVIVAVVCWLALAGATFFDAREARAVGARVLASRAGAPEVPPDPAIFTSAIGGRVRAARAARASISAAAEESLSPFDDVTREVDALVVAMQADAVRAQRIYDFLAEESAGDLQGRLAGERQELVRDALEAKLEALARLQQRLDRLLGQMDHVVATLQTVQADILATEGLEQRDLASQVSELRVEVRTMSDGLEEAFAETRVRQV